MGARLGIALMRLLGRLPLPVLRAVGTALGGLLYALVWQRRRVAMVNLKLCFPNQTDAWRRRLARQSFVYFAQTWLDRGWLWHAPASVLHQRLKLQGKLDVLSQQTPTIIFAPHFYGLDAGATALSLRAGRPFTSIYTPQSNPVVDAWIKAGRLRFGQGRVFERRDGVKAIVASLRRGEGLYLLPDMNFGPEESIFVPFYGVPAATVPSLSRFARLGKAQVVPVVTQVTPDGYLSTLYPAWQHFPSADSVADTQRMNRELETLIDAMPAQYYWVHKRFKTRPDGQPPVY